ncbi:protein phosphatase 2C domain-containing protein [Streptomyces sp. NPDC050848]|uniref:PP2C family protein-serine/threonine phosphatase n=1 Tax=Streptomyces sp. NPDC050848 TaxID=3155791 RepID=UPI0033F29B0E
MRPYATAQNLGDRSHQCDATAVFTTPDGATAYALLDGIGSNTTIQKWTQTAARRLARAAARHGDAEAGLRAVYGQYAAEPDRADPYYREDLGTAAAIVAVVTTGKPTTIAWCGDSRAYALTNGTATCLTRDHNLRRVFPPRDDFRGGSRNRITSYLGATYTDVEAMAAVNHPAIETHTLPPGPVRLLLASDGAYEPYEDAGHALAPLLDGTSLRRVARRFADGAVEASRDTNPSDPHADNSTVLIADIPSA